MTVEITMPDLSTTGDSVTLLRWLVAVGAPVKAGEPLLEIETDKATMEVESVATGTLQAIHAEEGDEVPVGQVIAVIDDGKDAPAPQETPVTTASPAPAPTLEPPKTADKPAKRGSMFARNKAQREESLQPEQPTKRQSMFARNKAQRDDPPADTLPLTTTQREVARRLTESKTTVPHYYLHTSANAEGMVAHRSNADAKPVWDAFFVKAVAAALQAYPRLTYRYDGDVLRRIEGGAIGVAADLDGALYVIPVEDAHEKTVMAISKDIRARWRGIQTDNPAAKRLGTTAFTISNLGAENVESFTAVINPPEAAILAVGKIAPVPHVVDGELVVQQRVNLTLAVDHRVANGKYAAQFLGKLVEELENFA